jgi:hypothetical protein
MKNSSQILAEKAKEKVRHQLVVIARVDLSKSKMCLKVGENIGRLALKSRRAENGAEDLRKSDYSTCAPRS